MQVLSVDFGGKEWVEVSSLRQLPNALAELPPFAVCCRLADIEPVITGGSDVADWLHSATDYLINATDSKLFTAWLEDSLPVGGIVWYAFSYSMVRCFVIDIIVIRDYIDEPIS